MRAHALRIAALLGVTAVLYCFTPPALPVCGFRWLTGRPCPLCGLTHAIFALAKGHWREALGLHRLSPLAVAMLAAIVWDRPIGLRLWIGCAIAFGIYGVVRWL
jgi:hypothetical protein